MPHETTVSHSGFYVAVRRIFLVHAHYAEKVGPSEELGPLSDEGMAYVDLAVYRLAPLRLTVTMRVVAHEETPFDLSMTYAAQFEMSERVPEEEREGEWRHIAAVVAPPLIYPYLREAVSALTMRSRGEDFALPLLPLPFDVPKDFEIPPAPDSEELELPLSAVAG